MFQSGNVQDADVVHHLASCGFSFDFTPPITPSQPSEPSTAQQPTTGRVYTMEFLMGHTGAQLKEIAKVEKVRPTGSKKVIAERIIQVCNPSAMQQSTQQHTLSLFDDKKFASEPPHHNYYRSHFNGVDLHNRYWYAFSFSFKVNHWRTKLLLSMLGSAVVNSWVLSCEQVMNEYKSFRVDAARDLCKFSNFVIRSVFTADFFIVCFCSRFSPRKNKRTRDS